MKYQILSTEEKSRIVGMHEGGMKCKDIGEELNVPCSTISTILTNWKVRGSVESLKSQCGRHRKISERGVRILVRSVLGDRRQPLSEISSYLNVCRNTTRTYLREMDFRSCIAPKKPYLSNKHKADRLAFARAHASWDFEDWCKVIWSDESSFELGKNSRQIRVWRKSHEKHARDCIAPSFKSGRTSVMVWGAFSGFDKSPLVPIPSNMRTASDFVNLVYEGTFSGFYFMHDDREQMILMEDGAPVHRSLLPLQWREAHGVKKLNWPANSPDLNPIENVWKIVKDLLRHHGRPRNKEEMVQTIQSVWDTIPLEQLHTFIGSMPDRMQAVILAQGGSTRW